MIHKWLLSTLMVGVLFLAGGHLHAQEEEIPPVVINRYDLHTIGNGEYQRQLTNYPYNSELVISPDGRYATYNSIPQVGIDAIERTGGFSGPMVENIWLIDILSGEAQRIADQPDPAYFWEDDHEDNVIARSQTSWSPDGTGIAWTDYYFEDGRIQLGVYDVATGQTVSLPISLPEQYAVPSPIGVMWLHTGIAIISRTFTPEAAEGVIIELQIFDETGTLLASNQVPHVNDVAPYIELFTRYQGRDYYSQYNSADQTWIMMDVLTGLLYETATSPEMVSINHPDDSITLRVVGPREYSEDQQLAGRTNVYLIGEILDADGNPIYPEYPLGYLSWDGTTAVYLSPDGQAFIHRPYDPDTRVSDWAFYLWRDGVETMYPEPTADSRLQEIAWGGQMWRIPDSATTTQLTESATFECEGALAPRLTVGQSAIVLPGGANRVRDNASTDTNTVGQIPEGATFSVIGGPACADDIVWWLVEYEGISGWTAEGVDDYFVEPVE